MLSKMTTIKLTNRLIETSSSPDRETVLWDSTVPGFGLRVRPTGGKTFIFQYRFGSGRYAPTRRITIGKASALTIEDARKAAKGHLADIALGNDPASIRAEARDNMLMSALCDIYLEEGCDHKKPKTIKNDRSRIERHIKPLLGKKRVNAITTADVETAKRAIANGKTACDVKTKKRGRAIVTGGKGTANQALIVLSAIYSFAIKRGLCAENPVSGVKKYKTRGCERFLSIEEIQRLGTVLYQAETIGLEWTVDPSKNAKHAPRAENRRTIINRHAVAAIRLLMLTGCRLGEILTLQWRFVDVERGMLFLPDSKTGKKAVVLGSAALAVLQSLPRNGRFVIEGETPDKHKTGIAKPWKRICQAANLTDVRIHDLRHTFASVGAMAGLSLPMIGKLLGHSQTSTTARYAHLANTPVKQAADVISEEIGMALLKKTS